MLWFAILAAATLQSPCQYDKAAMLALSYKQFDQDQQGGWRPLGQKAHCYRETAALISDYRQTNRRDLNLQDIQELYWHEGQARAMAGDYNLAVPLIMAGTSAQSIWGFEEYAIGTVAFLKHDLPALKAARERLANLPEPPDFAKSVADAKKQFPKFSIKMTWPPNLDMLDGFIACFDKPYSEAYGNCRPPPREP